MEVRTEEKLDTLVEELVALRADIQSTEISAPSEGEEEEEDWASEEVNQDYAKMVISYLISRKRKAKRMLFTLIQQTQLSSY